MRLHLPFLCLAVLAAPMAMAERYGDIEVTPIAGESVETTHGYAPYRFRVRNDGVSAVRVNLELSSSSSMSGLAQLVRAVDVPARASAEVVLYQPAENFYPRRCMVSVDGRLAEKDIAVSALRHDRHDYGEIKRFMLTSRMLTPDERDQISETEAEFSARTSGAGPVSKAKPALMLGADAVLPVAEWPSDWMGFSRWDAVAMTRDEFEGMSPAVRSALTQWVQAGGQLLVMRAGKADVPAEWKNNIQMAAGGIPAHGVGLGRAVFSASGPDARHAAADMFEQTKRAEQPAESTPECKPIEGGQIPVRGMFILMVVFAVAVGPANYFWCARCNRRIWILWTSPALAALFIAAVFAYALLSDGVRPWGQSAVVTLLDEKAHKSVTLGTTAWYAPILPGDGLSFSSMAEVRTVNKTDGSRSESRNGLGIVFGDSQRLTGGWMVPRYPESFGYRKVNESRLRMKFEKDAGGDLWAVNGLGVEVSDLIVNAGGRRLHCVNVAAGGKSKLEIFEKGKPHSANIIPMPRGDHWTALLKQPLFAELPFNDAKTHVVSETVIGRMEEPLP